jgi:hypothetical protein
MSSQDRHENKIDDEQQSSEKKYNTDKSNWNKAPQTEEDLSAAKDLEEIKSKQLYEKWVEDFNAKMSNIYQRLSKLEDFKDDEVPYSSESSEEPLSTQNRKASPSQARLIDEMYRTTPHLKDVDSLLRRVRQERAKIYERESTAEYSPDYKPQPMKSNSAATKFKSTKASPPGSNKDIQALIEESNRLLKEEFSDLAMQNDKLREYNISPRFGEDEPKDFKSPVVERKTYVSKSPFMIFSQTTTCSKSPLIRASTEPRLTTTPSYEQSLSEINKIFPHLLQDIENTRVEQQKKSPRNYSSSTRSDLSYSPPLTSKAAEGLAPLKSGSPIRLFGEELEHETPRYRLIDDDNDHDDRYEHSTPKHSESYQSPAKTLDNVSFQDIIRQMDETTEHIMQMSPSTSTEMTRTNDMLIYEQERKRDDYQNVRLNFPSSFTGESTSSYIATGTLSPTAQAIANNLHKIDYYSPRQQQQQQQQHYNGKSPRKDVNQTPPQRLEQRYQSPLSSEKIHKRQYEVERDVSPLRRGNGQMIRSPPKAKASPSPRKRVTKIESPGKKREVIEDEEAEIDLYEDVEKRRKKKGKEKAPIPYSDVRHLNQHREGNYNHSTIDWYLNLCNTKYVRTPSPPEKNMKVKWVGMQKNGRQV